ncbi:MAG: hypothetical protein WC782_15055 [Methylococcaceae bacterium]|jgi:biotin carboxylase
MHAQELIIMAHVPTESVNDGFLPAARSLGLLPVLITDQAEAHRQHFGQSGLQAYPEAIISCDVFNPLAVIEAISRRRQKPVAVFSNSDHLQTSTAIVAEYYQLPGKPWEVAYRAKNKAEMRTFFQQQGIETLRHAVAFELESLVKASAYVGYPCVIKPREGVASQNVCLAQDYHQLYVHCLAVWQSHPGLAMLIEEYLEGPLYTLETLGDGETLSAIGGFQVHLSAPPHFVELAASWQHDVTGHEEILAQIRRFGIGFGACHSEFVLTANGPRLIEINYRCIGDRRDFLLGQVWGINLFAEVLQLHLGAPVPTFALASRTAVIRYLTPTNAGRVRLAPDAFSCHVGSTEVGLHVLRKVGDEIAITHSNKDYLGILTCVGTDATHVQHMLSQAGNELSWEIGV